MPKKIMEMSTISNLCPIDLNDDVKGFSDKDGGEDGVSFLRNNHYVQTNFQFEPQLSIVIH